MNTQALNLNTVNTHGALALNDADLEAVTGGSWLTALGIAAGAVVGVAAAVVTGGAATPLVAALVLDAGGTTAAAAAATTIGTAVGAGITGAAGGYEGAKLVNG